MLGLALGKTVGELQALISPDELDSWREFYRSWPFDDFHRFYRPAALVAGAMSGGADATRKRLEWLQPSIAEPEAVRLDANPYEADEDGLTAADRDLFRAAGIEDF